MSANERFDGVSVFKKANVYFDGKCVSHALEFADGSRKSVGVIFPSRLVFNTGAPEVMEVLDGRCKVTFAGSDDTVVYSAGQSFSVQGNSSFNIETLETLHYVCHYG
jgi:uncharacterized protein YaiE (UPF0345 family)